LNARDYYVALQEAIHAAPHVLRSDMQFEEIDVAECYVRGVLWLIDGCELHVAEYIVTEPVVVRLKYRYHLQTSEGKTVSRWDNAAHHPEVSTFPDHRHGEQDQVYLSSPMSIPGAIEAALQFILPAKEA
jgi:hypothetical protein